MTKADLVARCPGAPEAAPQAHHPRPQRRPCRHPLSKKIFLLLFLPSSELFVSAVTGAGLDALRAAVAARLGLVEAEGELLVLARHKEALESAARPSRGGRGARGRRARRRARGVAGPRGPRRARRDHGGDRHGGSPRPHLRDVLRRQVDGAVKVSPVSGTWDVVVVGGGHAGAEAALAAARLGATTLLVTGDPATIGRMSCNPAVGGLAKGQVVREIDALGGAMGLVADRTAIQFKVLNASRGPAVRGLRCQSDKALYAAELRRVVESAAARDGGRGNGGGVRGGEGAARRHRPRRRNDAPVPRRRRDDRDVSLGSRARGGEPPRGGAVGRAAGEVALWALSRRSASASDA